MHLSTMRTATRFYSVLTNMKSNPIIETNNQFKIAIDFNEYAIIEYEKENNMYELLHSLIPDKFQGQGFGHILAQRIFDHLVERQHQFKITCEFLKKVYRSSPEKYERFVIKS